MRSESMHRTLAAQAQAIWPQERLLVERYALPEAAEVLDLGCGPGEISLRLLESFPGLRLLGLDIDPEHVLRAQSRCAEFGERGRFRVGDAFATGLEDDSIDLALCRHLLQALPRPQEVLAELHRVLRPGGRLHLLAEDYGMIYFHPTRHDSDAFWRKGPMRFAAATGTDLRSGRQAFSMLSEIGFQSIGVEYIAVDTTRVPRQLFAQIWTAWRDGYAEAVAAHSAYSLAEVVDHFDDMIECLDNPAGFGLWTIPVLSALKSG